MSHSTETNDAHIRRLSDLVETAFQNAGAVSGVSYALADFPFHNNTGDSAIWLGEVEALKRLTGRGPVYVSEKHSDPAEIGRFLPKDGVIFLHGGGNLGDIWPAHQLYREAIIAQYPDHKIVQLPQSIHYKSEEAIARSQKVFKAHPDLTLMVRDHKSADFARERFDCTVDLVPDAAFCIRNLTAPAKPTMRAMSCLLRDDIEKRDDAAAAVALFGDALVEDWRDLPAEFWTRSRSRMRYFRRLPNLPGLRATMTWRRAWLNRQATQLVGLGLAQLAESDVIVTDRLHGHILSTLAGRPHVTIDNAYGKIINFCTAWGTDNQTVNAQDYQEAATQAQAMLSQVRQGEGQST